MLATVAILVSPALARDAGAAEECPDEGMAPTPTAVPVTTVPIVVTSTTDDYFVLYVSSDPADAEEELPVLVKLGEAGTTTLAENVEALPAERYRVEKYLVADPADVDGDCVDDIAELGNPVSMNPVNPAAQLDLVDGAVAIPDRDTFETLSYTTPHSHIEYLKYFIIDLDASRPIVYFSNTDTHRIHQDFLDSQGLDLHLNDLIAGEITHDPDLQAPDGSQGVHYYVLNENYALYSFRQLARVFTVLAANMPLLEDTLVLRIPDKMIPGLQAFLPLLRESRIDLVFDQTIFPKGTNFVPLNGGTGYGLLRILAPGDRPNPRDVVVYEALPNELPRVAGILTTVPQTPLSHVNVRAMQEGVPNAFIRGALESYTVASLVGEYVRYEVTNNAWSLRRATRAEVDDHYESLRPAGPRQPERDLSVTGITPLSDIGFQDWTAFGVKAANVAVLGTLGFPEGTVRDGFAVPFHFYDEFMKHNDLYAEVEAMMAVENFDTDFNVQEDELDRLRDMIKDGTTPPWIITALEDMHAEFPEGTSLRYRSSTNNEDLPGFSGAGLYDSKTQDPDETEEDGIDKSIKGVWASLWNFRAFVERDFYRIDHMTTAMGVLVHPNFSDELVNGVAVSADALYGADDRYYVNSQVGEDLVTNPEAHSTPEELFIYRDTPRFYRVVRTSNLVPPGQLLMSDDQVEQLRQHLTVIHDEFAKLYGPGPDEPFAMEIEFKITSNDILAIKQARPWVFRSDGRDALPDPDPATTNPGGGGGGGGGGGSGAPPGPGDDEGEDDDDGEEGNDDGPGLPPRAAITVSAACADDLCPARTGVPVRFEDASSGSVRFRTWEFGEGTTSRRQSVEHAWSEPGFYEVTLVVSNGVVESTATVTFLVEASVPAGTCVPDARTRCLQNSRYALSVDWWSADGASGSGHVVHEGTNDSGLFRFFDSTNWEVLIKVLDGCALNGHVWVFGASTTNLGYLIRVTDTVTGAVKEYRNEPGLPAAAITDVTAFECLGN